METLTKRPGQVLKSMIGEPLPTEAEVALLTESIYFQLDFDNKLPDINKENKKRISYVFARQITRINQALGIEFNLNNFIDWTEEKEKEAIEQLGIFTDRIRSGKNRKKAEYILVVNPDFMTGILAGWRNPFIKKIKEARLETTIAHELYHIRIKKLMPRRSSKAVYYPDREFDKSKFIQSWLNEHEEKAAEIFTYQSVIFRPKADISERVIYAGESFSQIMRINQIRIYQKLLSLQKSAENHP